MAATPGKTSGSIISTLKSWSAINLGRQRLFRFRVVDQNIGLDIDISVRCNGIYSYRITNPLLFYTNVCGNVREAYTRTEIDGQLKSEFMSALQPALLKFLPWEFDTARFLDTPSSSAMR